MPSYLLTLSYQACRLFGHAMMLTYRVCILSFIFLFVCDKFRSVGDTGTVFFHFALTLAHTYVVQDTISCIYDDLIRRYRFMLIDSIFHLQFLYSKGQFIQYVHRKNVHMC